MKHTPITKQRSDWEFVSAGEILGYENQWLERRVNDGKLAACVGLEPEGWHLSISFRNHRGEPTRYPTWDEQMHAVRLLLPPGRAYHMIIPPDEDYVALHDSTFHWHEWREYR